MIVKCHLYSDFDEIFHIVVKSLNSSALGFPKHL